MNIGIVTVYNAQNAGSYLQAYALTQYLSNHENEAACLKCSLSDRVSLWRRVIRGTVVNVLRGRFKVAFIPLRQVFAFKRAYRKLNIICSADNLKCLVLGSDTIWDVSTPYFKNYRDFFWGTAFSDKRIISYAPSIGHAKKEHLDACPWIADALKRMDKVSVRDTGALALLQPLCDKEISLVCDPTFLLKQEQYMQIATEVKEDDFIFLYYYGHMPEQDVKQIKEIAARESLKIITFGSSNRWCGNNEPYDPLRFLGLYSKAKYVITNTFHGAVFAHIFHKKFAVMHSEKPKVIDLLARMGTSDKSTYGGRRVDEILSSEFCYDVIEQHIEKERETGVMFLKSALGEK